MRIVGGTLSGRRFRGPPGNATRPTTERAREAIASALDARDRIHDALVLDLYAGTGALAFEALSRGAAFATLVELDRRVARSIEASARELGLAERVRVITANLDREMGRWRDRIAGPIDLVFADPPYRNAAPVTDRLRELSEAGILQPSAMIVIEHDPKHEPTMPTDFERIASYRYGDSGVVMWLAPGKDTE